LQSQEEAEKYRKNSVGSCAYRGYRDNKKTHSTSSKKKKESKMEKISLAEEEMNPGKILNYNGFEPDTQTRNDKENILNYWYPVCYVKEFPKYKPYPFELWGEPLVFFYGKDGEITCLQDRCAHRSAPLSIGFVRDGEINCRYHGWRHDAEGNVTTVPSLPEGRVPKGTRTPNYPVIIREDMVWVWPGDKDKADPNCGLPDIAPENSEKEFKRVDQIVTQNYNYASLIENLLDPAHLQFVHQGTQGDYIAPVDAVVPESCKVDLMTYKEHKTLPFGKLIGKVNAENTAKPLRYIVVFEAPITVRLEVIFPNGWKFHQMHYCVPVAKDKTKLFLRSYRNWLRYLSDSSVVKANAKILEQDMWVLLGQNERLRRGASRYNTPVACDKMAVAYKKWKDEIYDKQGPWFKEYNPADRSGCGLIRCGDEDMEDLPRHIVAWGGKGMQPVSELIDEVQSRGPYLWPTEAENRKAVTSLSGRLYTDFGEKVFYVATVLFYLFVFITSFIYTLQQVGVIENTDN